ncbi:hypothetical protein WN943_006423 [Citrus x changshan-huyou]
MRGPMKIPSLKQSWAYLPPYERLKLKGDFVLPYVQCQNYENGLHSIFHTKVEDKLLELYKGASLNIVKAMASSLGLLASYKRIDEDIEAERTNHDVPMPYFGIGLE